MAFKMNYGKHKGGFFKKDEGGGGATPVYTLQKQGKTKYFMQSGSEISKQRYLELQGAWQQKVDSGS